MLTMTGLHPKSVGFPATNGGFHTKNGGFSATDGGFSSKDAVFSAKTEKNVRRSQEAIWKKAERNGVFVYEHVSGQVSYNSIMI